MDLSAPSVEEREAGQRADTLPAASNLSDASDELNESDDFGEYQDLRALSVEDQVSAAAVWSGDRNELDEFIRIITDGFSEREFDPVAALCKELRGNVKLPPMQRAHIEVWLSFMPGEDAGERLDEAKWWFAHVKRSLAPHYPAGPPLEVVAGLEMVDELRKGLVNDEDDDAEQDSRTMPAPILELTPASKLTKEQIGPEIPLDTKLRVLDQWAEFDRAIEATRREELAAAEGSATAGIITTAGASVTGGESAAEVIATNAPVAASGSMEGDVNAAKTSEAAAGGAVSGGTGGGKSKKHTYRNMMDKMPIRQKMRASNEAFLAGVRKVSGGLIKKKSRKDLCNMFNKDGAQDDKGKEEGDGDGDGTRDDQSKKEGEDKKDGEGDADGNRSVQA